MSYIVHDKRDFRPPPCPACGTTATVDWQDVRTEQDMTEGREAWVPARLRCETCPPHGLT